MKKKKLIIILILAIIIIISLLIMFNLKNKETITKVKENICEISSFTITDTGTEIGLTINNKTKQNINIKKITINLYDSTNKKIKTIDKEINSKLTVNKKIFTQISDQEKLTNTADIKCTIYKIN